MPVITALRLGFSVFLIVLFSYTLWQSIGFPPQAGIFPMVSSAVALVLTIVTLVIDTAKWRREGSAVGDDAPATASTAAYEPGTPIGYVFARAARYASWLLGYLLLMFLIGVVAAAAVFVTVFLAIEANVRWRYLWLAPVAVVALLLTLANAVNLFWPYAVFPIVE